MFWQWDKYSKEYSCMRLQTAQLHYRILYLRDCLAELNSPLKFTSISKSRSLWKSVKMIKTRTIWCNYKEVSSAYWPLETSVTQRMQCKRSILAVWTRREAWDCWTRTSKAITKIKRTKECSGTNWSFAAHLHDCCG